RRVLSDLRSATLTPGDDFGMMREVLLRRFSRLIRESPRQLPDELPPAEEDADLSDDIAEPGDWPDLVLIDGGQGQLNAAAEVLAELGLHDLVLVGVAKGPDRDAGI